MRRSVFYRNRFEYKPEEKAFVGEVTRSIQLFGDFIIRVRYSLEDRLFVVKVRGDYEIETIFTTKNADEIDEKVEEFLERTRELTKTAKAEVAKEQANEYRRRLIEEVVREIRATGAGK